MSNYYIGKEYTVSPSSIRFDQEMVEFNRVQTDAEYQATKASIALIGQTDAIVINGDTGLCEAGRHRVKACTELGIDVRCIQIDGKLDKHIRIALYNKEDMSGKDLTVAQKAIQAHKFILLTKQTIAEGARMFKSTVKNVGDANSIAGLGRTDILDTIAKYGEWTRPTGGKPVKSLRTIAQELRAEAEELEMVESTTTNIDYETMINTERGKLRFWELRTLMQMSQHEANMVLVKMLNYEYVLKVNEVTGEIDE